MITNKCEIVEDLLPLYVDDICSEESRNLVEEHIEHCDECKKQLEYMKENIVIPQNVDTKILKKIKRRNRMEKIIIAVVCSIALCFIMNLVVLALIAPTQNMNDQLKGLISVEEDSSGQLWLVRKGYATDIERIVSDYYREDGTVIVDSKKKIYNSGNGEENMVAKLQCYNSWFGYLSYKLYGNIPFTLEERNKIFTKNKEQIGKIVIDVNGEEWTIWENK